MAFFKRKDRGILDLTEKYRKDQERLSEVPDVNSSKESSNGFGFLGAMASSASSSESAEIPGISSNAEEKRRQLSKKLLNLTEKMEDISNQIYHLQQRIEVLERKAGVGGY